MSLLACGGNVLSNEGGHTLLLLLLLLLNYSPYKKPCVLDIKLGLRQFPPYVTKKKFLRQMKKSWNSTSRIFGVRIGGMQYWNTTTGRFESVNKFYGKKISCDDFVNYLIHYFSYTDSSRENSNTNKTRIRLDLVERMLKKVRKLKDVMSQPCSYRFFSSSLLLIYEGFRSPHYVSVSMTPPSNAKTKNDAIDPSVLESPTVGTSIALEKHTLDSTPTLGPQKPLSKRTSQDDSEMHMTATLIKSEANHNPIKPTSNFPIHSSDRKEDEQSQEDHHHRHSLESEDEDVNEEEGGDDYIDDNDDNDDNDDDDDDIEDEGEAEEKPHEETDETHNHHDTSSSSGGEECKTVELRSTHQTNTTKNHYKHFNPRRICVKMIDYSNIHPLKTFLPLMKEQRAKEMEHKNKDNSEQEFIWLDEQVDNEQEPDHGVLLGLECLCLLLTELKDTGTIKKRTDGEWTEILRLIPCYEKALKPLVDALKKC
ncbi:inositol hexaphosphate kinase 1 [Reticulomyxa filosa]|uniref:Kinase n=1 Tax=Reticulomyxa filosa TaxID=46433 RepID=X6N809_RETFI|nr:inositol hexaphosphate kinase 1 [Reticulomyxa filosa]|eukprot:ETO21432.1 inositol hexaphosphate kinase 1 [Reticulomyxa filosa]